MRRLFIMLALGIGAGAGGFFLFAEKKVSGAQALTGTWKTIVLFPGKEETPFIIRLEIRDGKLQGTMMASLAGDREQTTIAPLELKEQSHLRFSIEAGGREFQFDFQIPEKDKKTSELLGSLHFSNQLFLARLEKTDQKDLDPKKDSKTLGNAARFGEIMREKEGKEKQESLASFLKQNSEASYWFASGPDLVGLTALVTNNAEETTKVATEVLKAVQGYGRAIELATTRDLASRVVMSGKLGDLAVRYAKEAEKKLDSRTPLTAKLSVMRVLQIAYDKAGQANEANLLAGPISELENLLDEEFAKSAVPFKVEPITQRRKKSDRVVVVELFTGAECPPCVAADVAFDGLLKTFEPKDVVFLQYHEHIPGPDPLTSPDSEMRAKYYDIPGTPALFIDGKPGPQVGGGKDNGKAGYDELVKQLKDQLDVKANASLKVTASRKDDLVDIKAEVAGLPEPGESQRLHLVLIEEVVRHAGRNGQRLHHHVVRGFPGGADGFPLKATNGKQQIKVDLNQLKKGLDAYLKAYAANSPSPARTAQLFANRPMDLKKLKVVAFIQNDKDKQILQAAQVDLGGDK